MTARASWVRLTRRKPSEKLPVESRRIGWKDEIDGSGVAVKPLRSSWAVAPMSDGVIIEWKIEAVRINRN